MTRGDTQRIGDIWDRIIAARTAELYLGAAESAEDTGRSRASGYSPVG